MPLTLQPCNADEEVIAQELIRPVELQDTYLDGLCWAFVLDENDERIGALMWSRDGSNMPTDIEIAPTMIEATYPNQNLYWGVQ